MSGRCPMTEYARRHGLDRKETRDGALTLSLASHARLRMLRLDAAGVLLEARVCSLPVARPAREALIEHLLRVAAARMKTQSEACMLDAVDLRVLLRRRLPLSLDDAAFDEAVRHFARSVAHWKKLAVLA